MPSIQEINTAIIRGDFTNDQLTSIVNAVTFARSQLTQRNRRSLVIGTTVKFTNNRTGQIVTGTVEKMAIKFATVRTPTTRWRVPANMLEVV